MIKNFLFFILILFILYAFVEIRTSSKEYSDFATPEELIEKKQILPNSWQKLNAPFGGQGYTIRFDPAKTNKIIVTDSFSGIHISDDSGFTWKESNNGIDARTGRAGDSIPVFVVTIDPNNSERIWCGVKNAMGVFLSQDGGLTWEHKDNGLPSGNEVEIRGLAVKPGDSNTVFAAGDLEEIGPFMGRFQRTEGIVYKTIDGGQNWTQVLSGGNLFKDIIIDPKNPDVVYVGSGIFDRHQLEKTEGVYKSIDSGTTWTQINNGINNLYVTTIKFDPLDSNKIWGTTGMENQFGTDLEHQEGAVIVTKDGGKNWTEAKKGRVEARQIYSALGISPSNPNIIYASGEGVFVKSDDGGKTWVETGLGPRGTNAGIPIDITVDPNDENIVYVASYIGGIFKSTDGGKTWISSSFGYSGAETRGIAIKNDNRTIFTTARTGIFLSEDKGINWKPIGLGDIRLDELVPLAINPSNENKILVGGTDGIFLSIDSGMVWKKVFNNQQNTEPSSNLHPNLDFKDIEWSKSNKEIAYAAPVRGLVASGELNEGVGVLKSTDGGMTWINKQNGIPATKNTHSIAIDPTNENIVYAATVDSGIVKTVDGGENWVSINNGLENAMISEFTFSSIAINPTDPTNLIAGTFHDGRIFITMDSGSSWKESSTDISTAGQITSIVFNPSNSNQVFAGGITTGFYVSNDGGDNWEQFNNGLTTREVIDLKPTSNGEAIYAATNGGGIFRLPLSGDQLVLKRTQVETPSNAGINGINNAVTEGSSGGTISTSSSGGIQPLGFSLEITGSALSGINLNEKKSMRGTLLISNTGDSSKISITSDLPKSVIKIRPSEFVLKEQNSKNIIIFVKSIKKLRKVFNGQIPEKIILTIVKNTNGQLFSKDIEIPLIVK